ncbi:hypothetical protein BDW02DRAFT_565688 [Decorospora gaudefroyi]|uniref:Cylicin I n=1 Tax=Decorospora gaudefroyi TaxID=184978 RepID=A0A6A5KR68_9PLEO|nr:hypothetical protein BDW02DRAFT_565688 [Decorospora gaudefroyi]
MSFIRSTTLRASSFARAARPTRYIRAAELQPWRQAVQRRTYASGHGAGGDSKSSDVPWMAAAAVGTTVGLYIVVTQDTSHGAEHHPLGDPHGEGGAAKHGTESSVGDEDKEEDAEEESKEEKTSDQQDPDVSTKENSDEKDHQSPDTSDKADPRKEEPKSSNETSGKQKGLSNDETHHSSEISKQSEKSKKGEGVAETAKLQGTVSTERPGAENKEERGKSQIDKDT